MACLCPRRRLRRLLLLLAGSLAAAALLALGGWARLAQREACPACFGTGLCGALDAGQLRLGAAGAVAAALGAKGVLPGWLGDQRVVMKRLGHSAELQELDRRLCAAAVLPAGCSPRDAARRLGDVRAALRRRLARPRLGDAFRLCPSAAGLDALLAEVLAGYPNSSVQSALAHVWTLVHLNVEPLVLQILRAERGWPVPRYLGACGRLVVEEYAGQPLQAFARTPWSTRAALGIQLLQAARDFTQRHPRFRFYLTDVSPDNVAVDDEGHLTFVDLEHIIVLDKQPPLKERPPTWENEHVSENLDCEGCFAFSADDICSHHISDHNYYAICQELLQQTELLSNPPAPISSQLSELPVLLQECAHSAVPGHRLLAALRLMELLRASSQQA